MTRFDEITNAANEIKATIERHGANLNVDDFRIGSEWADKNPVNPWKDAEKEKPEKVNKFLSVPVLCRYTRGGREYHHVSQYDYDYKQWQIDNVTHWMPIPSLRRDEEDIDDPRLTEKQKKELGYK